jgi:NAD-dependent dihydropyrimidine dehydrogenase PreA subunit
MAFVIAEPCVSTCDTACVAVCPVDCIHGPIDKTGLGAEVEGLETLDGLQLYIDPDECIDCGACEPECPVEAIYDEDDLPAEWEKYTEINANFFKEN